MPSDSSAVDDALVAKLLADSTLMAITTDGVYFDAAPQGKTKFVIVSHMSETDEPMFGGTAYEDFTYLVKAVTANTTGADVLSAAARIHTILQDSTLAPTGYTLMKMHRVERIRYTEIEDASDRRWQHRGGLYKIQAMGS